MESYEINGGNNTNASRAGSLARNHQLVWGTVDYFVSWFYLCLFAKFRPRYSHLFEYQQNHVKRDRNPTKRRSAKVPERHTVTPSLTAVDLLLKLNFLKLNLVYLIIIDTSVRVSGLALGGLQVYHSMSR